MIPLATPHPCRTRAPWGRTCGEADATEAGVAAAHPNSNGPRPGTRTARGPFARRAGKAAASASRPKRSQRAARMRAAQSSHGSRRRDPEGPPTRNTPTARRRRRALRGLACSRATATRRGAVARVLVPSSQTLKRIRASRRRSGVHITQRYMGSLCTPSAHLLRVPFVLCLVLSFSFLCYFWPLLDPVRAAAAWLS